MDTCVPRPAPSWSSTAAARWIDRRATGIESQQVIRGKTMRWYAILLAIGLVASSAQAQQPSPPADPASKSSTAQPSSGVVSMEEPQPGDHWTYQIRDEITGKISGTRENVVTEVSPKNISLRYKMAGTSNEGFNVYDRSWNLLN